MKLYLHLDSQYVDSDPSTTIIKGYDLASKTVSSLIKDFLKAVGDRYGALEQEQLQLFSSPQARKAVPLSALVGKVFSDAADVYVVRSTTDAAACRSHTADTTVFAGASLPKGGNLTAAAVAAAVAEVPVQTDSDVLLDKPPISNIASEVPCAPEAAGRIPKVNSYSSVVFMPFWARADQCVAEQNPHGAVLIYEQVRAVQ